MQSLPEDSRPRVAIVYRYVPHYRAPFYKYLRKRLHCSNVAMELYYGQPTGKDAVKDDAVEVAWGRRIRNWVMRLGSRELIWQACLRDLLAVDLVVVEQASRLLINYVLLTAQRFGGPKVAFWGHGRNFQEEQASGLGEWLKRRISTYSHWWFAYNRESVQVVKELGYPSDRITDVKNSIDTRALLQARRRLDPGDLECLREQIGLRGSAVGLFIGGMYHEKRLDFLVEASQRIRREVEEFELLLVGSGPDASLAQAAANEESWIHWVGPVFGEDRVPLFEISTVLLMPGLVGLAVLDSFALETPMVTTMVENHSPEFDYLQHGVNGWIVEAGDDPELYAEAAIRLLRDPERLNELRKGCRYAARDYSIEGMADRFATGILRALEAARLGESERET